MSERVRAFTLLVPGPWRTAEELVAKVPGARARGEAPLESGDVDIQIVEDEAFGAAFAFGRGGPLPAELRGQIDRCRHAAVVAIALRLESDHAAVAKIGRALRDAGGLAVRMELSGGASTWDTWLARLDSGSVVDIYDAAVIMVRDGDTIFSVGMHHFDRPDAEVRMADPRAAIAWLDAFHGYQLVEDPLLVSGQTFRPEKDARPRVFERWPDARHHASDGRYNPFGVYRFLDEKVKARAPSELVPTIMPSLVAMLMAQENAKRAPLTKREVETLVAKAPAIMIQRDHARALERSRGYADIDPELAWEQWQIVRQSNG
jgi:hypothetical protein